MRLQSLTTFAAVGAFALLAGGCAETTTPQSLNPIDVALDFCANDIPVWFAYQNIGTDWVRVAPDAEGTFRFAAARRVAIAFVHQSGTQYVTDIMGVANTELSAISGTACLDDNGTKILHGNMAGATGSQLMRVSMFLSTALLPSTQSAFTLTQLAERPLDLVASRVNVTGSTQVADRIIIRRNQNFVNNATVPVLDFASSEAFTPGSSSVGVSGVVGTEQTAVFDNFFSQQHTSHLLYQSLIGGNGSVTIPTVPAALTAALDYHDIFVVANATDGSRFRGAESYFRNPPATQILPMGPDLPSNPVFTTVSTTPYVQMRMQQALSSTALYDRAVSFVLSQQSSTATREVNVTVTDGFWPFTNSGWDVTIPDFSGVQGWQNIWGLETGATIDWTVTAYFGRPTLLFGAAPNEGEGIQFAGRRSTGQPAALMAATALQPRSFSHRR